MRMLLYGLDVNRSSGGNIRNMSFKDWFCVERLKAECITQLKMFMWFITDSAANDHNVFVSNIYLKIIIYENNNLQNKIL